MVVGSEDQCVSIYSQQGVKKRWWTFGPPATRSSQTQLWNCTVTAAWFYHPGCSLSDIMLLSVSQIVVSRLHQWVEHWTHVKLCRTPESRYGNRIHATWVWSGLLGKWFVYKSVTLLVPSQSTPDAIDWHIGHWMSQYFTESISWLPSYYLLVCPLVCTRCIPVGGWISGNTVVSINEVIQCQAQDNNTARSDCCRHCRTGIPSRFITIRPGQVRLLPCVGQ